MYILEDAILVGLQNYHRIFQILKISKNFQFSTFFAYKEYKFSGKFAGNNL